MLTRASRIERGLCSKFDLPRNRILLCLCDGWCGGWNAFMIATSGTQRADDDDGLLSKETLKTQAENGATERICTHKVSILAGPTPPHKPAFQHLLPHKPFSHTADRAGLPENRGVLPSALKCPSHFRTWDAQLPPHRTRYTQVLLLSTEPCRRIALAAICLMLVRCLTFYSRERKTCCCFASLSLHVGPRMRRTALSLPA